LEKKISDAAQASENASACQEGKGRLPSCANLAYPYVPMQPENSAAYDAAQALTRGTLFPGLDLSFMNYVATDSAVTGELSELMALDFVVNELGLYLDTHQNDTEALEVYTQYAALAREARRRYVAAFGPLEQTDVELSRGYTWLKNPWPWDFRARNGG